MKKFLILLLISSLVIAGSEVSSGVVPAANGSASDGMSAQASYNSSMSEVMVRIQARLETNASTDAEYDAFLQQHALLVVGDSIDLGERLLLETAKGSNAWLGKIREVNDSEAAGLLSTGRYKLVMLIGGPEQNNISALAKERGWLNETNNVEAGFILENGKDENGAVVIMISDRKGYDKDDLQRRSSDYSPLRAVLPKEYIPLGATILSMGLLVLVNILWNVFAFKALDIGRKGKKVGEGAWMVRGINMAEVAAIVAASVVLGISISWQYFGPTADFAGWLLINSAICLFAALTHEISHMVLARGFGIKIEYRLWPAGSVLTLVSSYLGNAFAIQGFILEEIPQGIAKWKVGIMKLAAPAISLVTMIIFAMLNLLHPDPIYKIIYTTAGVWAMAEILPFGSLDGKDIKDWNRDVWYVSFFIIGASYFIVTFLI